MRTIRVLPLRSDHIRLLSYCGHGVGPKASPSVSRRPPQNDLSLAFPPINCSSDTMTTLHPPSTYHDDWMQRFLSASATSRIVSDMIFTRRSGVCASWILMFCGRLCSPGSSTSCVPIPTEPATSSSLAASPRLV